MKSENNIPEFKGPAKTQYERNKRGVFKACLKCGSLAHKSRECGSNAHGGGNNNGGNVFGGANNGRANNGGNVVGGVSAMISVKSVLKNGRILENNNNSHNALLDALLPRHDNFPELFPILDSAYSSDVSSVSPSAVCSSAASADTDVTDVSGDISLLGKLKNEFKGNTADQDTARDYAPALPDSTHGIAAMLYQGAVSKTSNSRPVAAYTSGTCISSTTDSLEAARLHNTLGKNEPVGACASLLTPDGRRSLAVASVGEKGIRVSLDAPGASDPSPRIILQLAALNVLLKNRGTHHADDQRASPREQALNSNHAGAAAKTSGSIQFGANSALVDSGASFNVCCLDKRFWDLTIFPRDLNYNMLLGDMSQSSRIHGIGTVQWYLPTTLGKLYHFNATCYLIPDFSVDIISANRLKNVSQCLLVGGSASEFGDWIITPDGHVAALHTEHGLLTMQRMLHQRPGGPVITYCSEAESDRLMQHADSTPPAAALSVRAAPASMEVWHQRLLHRSDDVIRKTAAASHDLNIRSTPPISSSGLATPVCPACPMANLKRTKIKIGDEHVPVYNKVNQRIAIDTMGPLPKAYNDMRYIICSVDVVTGDTLFSTEKLKNAPQKNLVERRERDGVHPDEVLFDGGGENLSKKIGKDGVEGLRRYLEKHSIRWSVTAPDTPQHNSKCEVFLALATAGMRVSMLNSGVRAPYWPIVLTFVATLMRITWTTANHLGDGGTTPWQECPANNRAGVSRPPSFKRVYVFGSVVTVLATGKIGKLEPRGHECLYVAPDLCTADGILFFNPRTLRMARTRNAIVDEARLGGYLLDVHDAERQRRKQLEKGAAPDLAPTHGNASTSSDPFATTEYSRSTRLHTPSARVNNAKESEIRRVAA